MTPHKIPHVYVWICECKNELINERVSLCMNYMGLKFNTLVWRSQEKFLVRLSYSISFKVNFKNILAKFNFILLKTEFLQRELFTILAN